MEEESVKEKFTTTLDSKVKKRLKIRAKKRGLSISALITVWLEEDERKELSR